MIGTGAPDGALFHRVNTTRKVPYTLVIKRVEHFSEQRYYNTIKNGTPKGAVIMKNVWIVKGFKGYGIGWQEIKRFDNPGAADMWLMDYIRENNYIVSDFTIS